MQLQLHHPLPGPYQHFMCLTGRPRHGVGHPSGFHTPVPDSLRKQAKAALQSTV